MDLLESADLKQHVRSKTRISGRLYDLLITRSRDDFLTGVYVDRAGLLHVKRDLYTQLHALWTCNGTHRLLIRHREV